MKLNTLVVFSVLPFLLVAHTIAGAAPNPWTQIGAGLHSAPPWVGANVERRLWLLDGMPAVQDQIDADAQNDFQTTKGPSLAAGIVLEDGLYFSHGAGFRDIFKHHVADDTTIYEVGSLTKVFTGTALLTMIDNPHGRKDPDAPMSLDDDVQTKGYYPFLSFVCPPPGGSNCNRGHINHGITLRHLVSHTAGLPDGMVLNGNVNTDEITFSLVEMPNTWTIFKPGQRSAYSGDGTAIVGIILGTQSTEQSYAKYVEHHLLAPLGMKHSGFDPAAVPSDKLAMKYDFDTTTNKFTAHPIYDGLPSPNATVLVPTAALFTSVYDLSRFMHMFLTAKAPEDDHGHEIIKSSTLSLATKPLFTAPVPGPSVDAQCNPPSPQPPFSITRNGVTSDWRTCGANNEVGVNWFFSRPGSQSVFWNSGPYVQHNGGLPSFETQTALDLDPNHTMGATVLISVDRGMANNIAANFFAIALQRDITATTKAADGSIPSWTNERLAIGAARLLWMFGVEPLPLSDGPKPLPPGSKPLPPGWVKVGDVMETEELLDRQKALLSQFAPDVIHQPALALREVQDFVMQLRQGESPCSTFRVRAAESARASIRLRCGNSALDVKYKVEPTAPYRLTDVTTTGASDPY
jgi:CubicO group peptidase (beta-lactamase class C family)